MALHRSLDGRRVVITGSTRGLGLAFARELAARGACVVINGRTEEGCQGAIELLRAEGLRVVGVSGAAQHEEVAERLVATCVDRFGGLDLAINNAGITRDRTLIKMSADEFDEVIAVHLRGAWAVSRAAARAMAAGGGGAILNVVSGTALYGHAGQSNYAAAKGGMLAMTRALSIELARRDIVVNALYPVARTDMTEGLAQALAPDAPPLCDPADIAPAVAFFASEEGRRLTGQVVHFDGRDLTVWTHPQPAASASRPAWTAEAVAAFFAADPDPREPLHPDRWGLGAQSPTADPRHRDGRGDGST